MNVASDTGNGVLEAAKVAGKYAIGVDLDQDAIYPGHIITSMLKRVDMGVYTIIKSVVEGTYKGGTVVKLGISNGGVGITDMSVMGDKIPTEVREKVKELEAKVTSGEIKVVNYPGFEIGE
jgi:basic membrane protein A